MDDPVAMRCEGVIDATRMVPGAAPLNTQLRVADVLDLERHPTIPFEAHATQRLGPTELAGTATIEIRGERRELPLRIAFGEQRRIGTPTGEEASIGLRARAALTRDELLATPGRVPERQSAGRSRIDIAVHLQALLDQTLGADSSLR